jgi:polyphosphate kinase
MKQPLRPFANYPVEHFINREISLLRFQRRVLSQAADRNVPLLERLRFLCIVSSNLDEFFEIRVSGIKEQIRLGIRTPGSDGLTPAELLDKVSAEVHALIAQQYELLNEDILPALEAEGVVFLRRGEWTEEQGRWIEDYFEREVSPVLTPIGLDQAHPFPRVLNKSLNFAIELEGRDAFGRDSDAAIVQAPRALPRVIRLPREIGQHEYTFVFLSSVMHAHVDKLFTGMRVLGCYQFRLTRNSDLFVDEEEVESLMASLKGELQQRHFGDAVRLEIADTCSEEMEDFLLQQFRLQRTDVYRTPGIVNLVRLMQVPDWVNRPDLSYPPFTPGVPRGFDAKRDIFAAIRRQDLLLHHPFQSFEPVVQILREAVDDPQVLAIKMTVYRTGAESVLMDLLARAAQKGKEVTVVMELMARFDEEANIMLANRLEQVGAHVVYGVVGYKTHAKMLMVVRREAGRLVRYVHLGTGNYHPRTTRFYTDFGLLRRGRSLQAAHRAGQGQRAEAPLAGPVCAATQRRGGHQRRDRSCARRKEEPHHREDECAAGTRDHRGAVCRLAGRRTDRPDRAWPLRPETGCAGPVREHPRTFDRRSLPRTPPHLPLPRRRRGHGVSVERRLDGPQLLPPHRDRLSGTRSEIAPSGHPRRAARLHRR